MHYKLSFSLSVFLASLVLIVGNISPAYSDAVDLATDKLVLANSAELLMVEDPKLDADTIIQDYLHQEDLWQPYAENYTVDITNFRKLWIKLTVTNAYPVNRELFVVAAEPSLVDGEFILVKDRYIIESWNLGSQKPFHQRPIDNPYYLIPFNLRAGETTTVLIAMNGIGFADRIWIEEQHSFWAAYQFKTLSDGLFLGAMIILSLITIMLYVANKDRLFLYFALMIFGSLVYHLTRAGYGFQLLWPGIPGINARILMFSISLQIVGSILFSMRFLQLRTDNRPWLYRISRIFLALAAITCVIAIVLPLQASFTWVFGATAIATLYFILIWFHAAFRALKKDRRAQFFSVAWLLYLLPYVFSSLYNITNLNSEILSLMDHRNGEVLLAIALFIALLFDLRKAEADKQLAIADSAAKTKFLATMSHELRTPLNGVIGTAELLSQTEQTPIQSQYSNIIVSSGKVLLTLINDILDLTKISGGDLAIEEKPFCFDQILSECSSTFIPMMLQKNIPLHSSIHPKAALCLIGDEYRLRQVLFNLLSNAMKFTEHGQVTVTANTVASNQADSVYLVVAVSDTGIGIEPEQLKEVFKQFTQADASTTRRFGGSGLGLAICQSIVEKMGGSIKASSKIGKGSTFEISIPIKVDLEREKLRHQALENLQGKKFLTLSDYPNVLGSFKHHFIEWGATIDTVETPEQVNQILEGNHSYDALIAILVTEPILVLEKIDDCTIPLLLLHHGVLGDIHSDWQGKTKTLPVPAPLQDVARKLLALLGYSYPSSDIKQNSPNKPASNPLPILIAEDNPTNQTVVKKMLENLGFSPDLANNGLEAVDMAAKKDYAIIMMDCEMPMMDGFMACEKILARETLNPPVIVALTAHVMKDTEERCLAAGMQRVLTKPVSMNRLQELFDELGQAVKTTENS